MGLLDKMKAQAGQVGQKAQEAGRAGQAKLDQAQQKRRVDALFRDLGAAAYAERIGRGGPDNKAEIDRLVEAVSNLEAEHGQVSTAATADQAAPPTGETPGDFKLDG